MAYFDYSSLEFPIRGDISEAFNEYWDKLAAPGSWWTGAERIAIAEETRNAVQCNFCQERKQALSPNSVSGEHFSTTDLNQHAVDAAHRIITDQTRITQAYVNQLADNGISNEAYVELAGIVVCVFSIDEFHRALGLPYEQLPEPVAGEPDHYRPAQAEVGTGFVPMLPKGELQGAEADLWPNGRSANVIRAFSLVPQAVRDWLALASAQYLSVPRMADMFKQDDRAIDRMQMELVAGRVSAVNECFY